MNAELIYGVLFLAVVIVIISSGGLYMWFTREKPVKKRPPPAPPTLTPEQEEHKPGTVYIPPEVPRTVGTIKQMVKEDPKLIENVMREWIKGGTAPDAIEDSEKKTKRRK